MIRSPRRSPITSCSSPTGALSIVGLRQTATVFVGTDDLASWIRRELGASDAAVVGRLDGSSSATVYEVRIGFPTRAEQLAVAKVFNRDVVSTSDAMDHVACEADRLGRATAAALPAPEPLMWDASGTSVGVPVIVMTRLPGKPLPRPTVPGWIEGFASTLARIARAAVDLRNLPVATSWRDPDLARPDWFTDQSLWVDAMNRADAGLTGSTDGFIHRDFHTLNVLWAHGSISGIVDWLHACRGPIELDIAACRVNLALTSGVDTADEFTRACQRAGLGRYDIVHDLEKTLSLAAYSEVLLTGNDVGADITLDGVRQVIIEMTRNAMRG